MAKTCQQVSRTLAPANEQTQEHPHNERYSTIDEVEEHARQLYYFKQNVDTMRSAMELVEATLMQMAQNMYSQISRQIEP